MKLAQLRFGSARQRLGLALSALAVGGILFMACGSTSDVNTGSVVSGSASTAPAAQHFKVGQQVKVGGVFVVTVNSFKTNPGDQFDQPKAGDEYVVVDVTIKNISAKEQDISSLLNFNFNDATGQQYTEAIISSATPPDGKIEPGMPLRGQLAYEVPKSQHKFTLAFQSDAFSSGETIWDLSI